MKHFARINTNNVDNLVRLNHADDWRAFADYLFTLEDADPGYVMLLRANLPYSQKKRFVLAWCAYYNLGAAAIASEHQGADFYSVLRAMYPTVKRNSERRHFRGKAGLKALADWERAYPFPEGMVDACHALTYTGVRKNMQDMTQMGDYFYWKLADIWDTVLECPIDFTGCEKYMPKVPRQGANMICDLIDYGEIRTDAPPLEMPTLKATMDVVTAHIRNIPYGPKRHRKLALQEAETVCCVFKQHVVGDYRYGFRSAKAYRRLMDAWPEAPKTVGALLHGMYVAGHWDAAKLGHIVRNYL